MSMQLAPPAKGYHEHTLLDWLIKQINEDVITQETKTKQAVEAIEY